MDEAQKEKYDVRRIILHGRKFDEGAYSEDADQTGDTDHGVFLSGNFIQHYRYGMGRTARVKAVAGIGVGGMFTWLSQGFASMARMGGQVQVAQCVGRGDKEKAHGYAQAAVQLATVMGLVYALVVLIFTKQMIGFFKLEDPEAYAAAFVYTKIACGLIVFSFLSVTLTGIYTAQGDSKTPFYANLIGLATNMILDPLLILGPGPLPKLGAAGGAIATVTAQFIVMSIMILGIVKQKKENVLKGITLFTKIPAEYLNGICKIGTYCDTGNGILRDIDGNHPHGIGLWCRSHRHTACGRTD